MEPQEQEDLLVSSQHPSVVESEPKEKPHKESEPKASESSSSSKLPYIKNLAKLQSISEAPYFRNPSAVMDNFERIMDNNKIWAKSMLEQDPDFFNSLVDVQRPEYLWIGCSDSRVPAN